MSYLTLFCILTCQKQDLTEKKFLWLVIVSSHHSKIILSLVTVILPGKVLLGNPLLDWYLSMRDHKHSRQLYATEAM